MFVYAPQDARLVRFADLDDQVEACHRVFASDRRLMVVRRSDLEEGENQGLPVWSRHAGDPMLESNIMRRVDFALFMVETREVCAQGVRRGARTRCVHLHFASRSALRNRPRIKPFASTREGSLS